MNEIELRQEICRVGRSLFERGYIHSTAGNISVRLADGFLITPTEACLGFLKPEALSKVGSDGLQISGDRASKTLTLHRRIYAADADAEDLRDLHGLLHPPGCAYPLAGGVEAGGHLCLRLLLIT